MLRHHKVGRLVVIAALVAALIVLAIWPAAAVIPPAPAPAEPADWAAPHVAGQLLVKLPAAGGATTAAADPPILVASDKYWGIEARLAAAGVRVLRAIPQLGLALVEAPAALSGEAAQADATLAAVAADLADRGLVEWAEPNYTFELDFVPNDPDYASRQSPYLSRLQMPAAWDFTVGAPQIIIAIVDTGVDLTHEDLRKGIWTNPGEIPGNGLDDDLNGFVDDVHGWDFADDDNVPDDDYGHGTHVAGIAAARLNNGIGVAGMAGGAMIMPVDVFPTAGYGAYDDLILAMIYATDNGARVINMSLGATSYSRGEEAAVNYAWSHDVVVVAAAGNTGRNSYHYPAAHPNAIAVAATDAADASVGFSTRGDFVDVAAPGLSVWSTYKYNRYSYMSGTSMATPHVAGLAALVLSFNPALNPDEVRALIEDNADDLGAAGWDIVFGHGRINARRTLAAVNPRPGPTPSPTPGSSAPLPEWPVGCQDLIADGGFEAGLGLWQVSGDVAVDTTRAYAGSRAAHFRGGPNTRGTLTRTVTLPAWPVDATLFFPFRIENQDQGWGSTPQAPYDDWFTAELRTPDGRVVSSLLRTGNSADTATDGLPWDRYLYRMGLYEWRGRWQGGQMALVFSAANDADNLPTDVWIDAVRLCVKSGRGLFLPLFLTKPP